MAADKLVQPLHAGGGVQRIAQRAVFQLSASADIPDQCHAGVHADAGMAPLDAARRQPGTEALARLVHRQGGGHRAVSVVRLMHRRTEQHHKTVADEVVHQPSILHHCIGQHAEILAQ